MINSGVITLLKYSTDLIDFLDAITFISLYLLEIKSKRKSTENGFNGILYWIDQTTVTTIT